MAGASPLSSPLSTPSSLHHKLTRHGRRHLEEDGPAGAQADKEGPPVKEGEEGV